MTGLRSEVRVQCDQLRAETFAWVGSVLAAVTIVALVVALVLLLA